MGAQWMTEFNVTNTTEKTPSSSIGMVKVHAFLICDAFFLWRKHWEGVLKEMNFDDRILSKHLNDKNGNDISSMYWEKIDWNYKNWLTTEKSLIITFFKLFTDIFTQNSAIKSLSSTGAS